MTSEQICPLCGKEMYYDSDDDLYECQSEACFLYAQEFFESDLEVLASQIARIKQEAQESLWAKFWNEERYRIEKQASKIEELEKKLIEYQKRNRELGNKLFEIPGLECDCDGSGSEDGHELMCPFKPFQSVIDELRGEK